MTIQLNIKVFPLRGGRCGAQGGLTIDESITGSPKTSECWLRPAFFVYSEKGFRILKLRYFVAAGATFLLIFFWVNQLSSIQSENRFKLAFYHSYGNFIEHKAWGNACHS